MWIDVNHDHLKALRTMDFLNLFYLNCSFSVVARTRSVPARCVHHCAQNYTSIIRRNEPTYEKTLRRAYCVWAKGRAIIYPDSDFRVASYRQTPSSTILLNTSVCYGFKFRVQSQYRIQIFYLSIE